MDLLVGLVLAGGLGIWTYLYLVSRPKAIASGAAPQREPEPMTDVARRFCPKCGTEIVPYAAYCHGCGLELERIAP
jgi:hypothetical protein